MTVAFDKDALALDAAQDAGARNGIEKMLAHQLAAAHRHDMRLTGRAGDAWDEVERWREHPREIEAPIGTGTKQHPRDTPLDDVERNPGAAPLVPGARVAADAAIVSHDEHFVRLDHIPREGGLDRLAHR